MLPKALVIQPCQGAGETESPPLGCRGLSLECVKQDTPTSRAPEVSLSSPLWRAGVPLVSVPQGDRQQGSSKRRVTGKARTDPRPACPPFTPVSCRQRRAGCLPTQHGGGRGGRRKDRPRALPPQPEGRATTSSATITSTTARPMTSTGHRKPSWQLPTGKQS